MSDPVNHPSHYETGKFECIDVMEEVYGVGVAMCFCLGNMFKYAYRCQSKHDTPAEDLAKAQWYLNRFLSYQEKVSKEDWNFYMRWIKQSKANPLVQEDKQNE